ncbi:MAG: 5-formyltetrahydrofolate cyclo-ligase [Thioalkalispiraceae bacterium]|jgi:5-formyltetrahydrofolate cyclo-ligase
MNSRNDIRNRMRQQRSALSLHQRIDAAGLLNQHIASSSLFLNSQHIAFYLPNEGEMDISSLITLGWALNKHCYLPVLGLRNSRKMWFAPYTPDTPLIENRFAIPEPQHHHSDRLFKAQSLDLIFMPLVAFDKQGNRLGMGGGFYDRTLQFLLHRQFWKKPHLIGTAYAFQEVPELEHASWDVPMQGIATENGLQFFTNTTKENKS